MTTTAYQPKKKKKTLLPDGGIVNNLKKIKIKYTFMNDQRLKNSMAAINVKCLDPKQRISLALHSSVKVHHVLKYQKLWWIFWNNIQVISALSTNLTAFINIIFIFMWNGKHAAVSYFILW